LNKISKRKLRKYLALFYPSPFISGYAANSEILSYKKQGLEKEEVNILSVVEHGFLFFSNRVEKKEKVLRNGFFLIVYSIL
jgi:hypothetical protein